MSLEKTTCVSTMALETSRAVVQESGWGNLAAGIIDGIVNILKRWKRWKLDSPALRRVNKHWSQQISQHIIAIHPCWAKVLTKQDATSLLHFPRITSLDISPFLHGFRRREANAELKDVERRLIVKAFRAELNRVIGILSQLSHLTHLDLDASLQRRQGHPFCIERCEEWSRLEHITSLGAYGAHRVQQPIPWGHRDQEPWYLDQRGEWDATQLCQLIRHFPRLRRLNARTYAFAVPQNLTELCRLESLELETGGSVEFVLAVDELAPLKTLGAIAFPLNQLELTRQLHHLKSLTLNVQTVAVLITPAFFAVMKNLRCLGVQSEGQWSRLPDDFVRTSIALKSLTLSNFQLRGETLLKRLPALTDLALRRCVLLDDDRVLDWPTSIRALSLTKVTDRQGHYSMPFPSDRYVLPNICRLTLIPIKEVTGLNPIVQLKTLETLELGVDNDSTLAGMDALQNLPELRHLSLKVTRKVLTLPTFLSLEFFTNLDALSFSGRTLVAAERQKLDGIFKRSRRA